MADPAISVAIPVYRSEEILPVLYERLSGALEALGREWEIVLCCDCSPDGSWAVIRKLAAADSRVRGLLMRRNVGYDRALSAAIAHTRGDVVVTMDDDLQHAPEAIATLLAALTPEMDLVYAQFVVKRQSAFKNFGSWVNDIAARLVLRKPAGLYLSPFKLMRGDLAREVAAHNGPYPYVDGLLLRATGRVCQVPVTHQPRYSGRGGYTLIPSLRIWLNHVTGFSVLPLRLASILGLGTAAAAVVGAIFLIWWRLTGGQAPTGWAALLLAIMFFGGIQLIALGAIGEYLGRAYMILNGMPTYSVRETTDGAND